MPAAGEGGWAGRRAVHGQENHPLLLQGVAGQVRGDHWELCPDCPDSGAAGGGAVGTRCNDHHQEELQKGDRQRNKQMGWGRKCSWWCC